VVHHGRDPAWSASTLPNGKAWTRAMTWLQGVDAAHHRAYVTHEALNGGGEFEVVTVDLSTGAESSWVATNPDARMRAFHPLAGPFDEDLARYGAIVEATGPFVVRARDFAGPHMAVTKDWLAYESDPDVLVLAHRDGSQKTRLAPATKAAYQPIFSADGARVAFTACKERSVVPPGSFYRCVYHVYVARIGEAPVAYDVTQPQPPTFSFDGHDVFAASRDIDHDAEPHDRGGCAKRIDLEKREVHSMSCASDLHDVDLETGEHAAVFHGWRGKLGEQIRELRWLALPSGTLRATIEIDRGTSNVSYGGGNYAFGNAQGGIVAVDLRTNAQEKVLHDPRQSTWLTNQWKDDHTVYAIRTIYEERAWELLELDARAIIAR
jgi:hypothetical protein